jgi:hypothetical protein
MPFAATTPLTVLWIDRREAACGHAAPPEAKVGEDR